MSMSFEEALEKVRKRYGPPPSNTAVHYALDAVKTYVGDFYSQPDEDEGGDDDRADREDRPDETVVGVESDGEKKDQGLPLDPDHYIDFSKADHVHCGHYCGSSGTQGDGLRGWSDVQCCFCGMRNRVPWSLVRDNNWEGHGPHYVVEEQEEEWPEGWKEG